MCDISGLLDLAGRPPKESTSFRRFGVKQCSANFSRHFFTAYHKLCKKYTLVDWRHARDLISIDNHALYSTFAYFTCGRVKRPGLLSTIMTPPIDSSRPAKAGKENGTASPTANSSVTEASQKDGQVRVEVEQINLPIPCTVMHT